MEFFVQVAFDFIDATARDYEGFEVQLSQIYLGRTVPRDGAEALRLPHNTFAGILRGKNATEVIERVRREISNASQQDGLHGRYFVSVLPKDSIVYDGSTF